SCREEYHLDAALRGQRIVCPNPVCREVFEVQDAEADAAKPTTAGDNPVTTVPAIEPSDSPRPPPGGEASSVTEHSTGSVADLIPMLDAEVVHEVPPPAAESPPTPIHVHPDEDAKPIP